MSIFQRRQRGAVIVEFALVLIPLLTMAFGISEFGRALYQYNTLAKATRDAARYLSTQAPGNSNSRAVAACLAKYGKQNCTATDQPLVLPWPDSAAVTICDAASSGPSCPLRYGGIPTGSGTVDVVTVSITGFRFSSLVSFVVPDITFGAIGTTMRQI